MKALELKGCICLVLPIRLLLNMILEMCRFSRAIIDRKEGRKEGSSERGKEEEGEEEEERRKGEKEGW
jgi:hypothetical protein